MTQKIILPLFLRHAKLISQSSLALYAILILWLSLMPSTGTHSGITHLDKLAHFCAYFIYALLAAPLIEKKRHRFTLFIALFSFGLLIECLQSLVPSRQMSLLDLAANTLGAGIGLIAAQFVYIHCFKTTDQ